MQPDDKPAGASEPPSSKEEQKFPAEAANPREEPAAEALPSSEPPATSTEKNPPAKDPLSERQFRGMNRRQLLSLSPLVLAGAFALPRLRAHLLAEGLRFSDWASGKYFRGSRRAPTFADSELVPLERFPYNGYDVLDPGVDLEDWALTVEGQVQKPGDYALNQIRALPKISQNIRHVCVEGWDAIGNFAGARASDFLHLVGADTGARFVEVECADDYYESYDMASVPNQARL